MESELNIRSDFSNRRPVVDGEHSPQGLSESLLRSTLFQLNTQNDNLIGLPMLSSLQREPFKDHSDRTVIYDGMLNRASLNHHELCLGGTSLASGSLGTLASRNSLNDDMNNPVVLLQPEVPSESLREMYSNGFSYVPSTSVPNSIHCGYDSLAGDVNGRWNQDRFLMQPELSWRTSTSGLESLHFSENQNANQWMLPSSANVCSSHPYGTSIPHNELSLSLATCRPSLPGSASIQDHCSNISCTSVIHNSQHQTRIGSECSSHGNKDLSLGFASHSRSTQFPQIIYGSRYLGVVQQILSEFASYSQTSFSTGLMSSSSNHLFSSNHFNNPGITYMNTNECCDDDGSVDIAESSYRRREVESKKSQLLSLLQVIDDCYSQCLDEIHTVVSAFHAATELDPQLHACFALRTISFFYKNLRERISNEILALGIDRGGTRDNRTSFEKSFIQKQWALQQLKRNDQQLWRPQRGLPERSVSVLRAWMFDNFLHPYPKDAEKHLLAIKSGLTRSQVSNWFINARVRLWKPLVEEMCEELNRRKWGRQNDEVTNNSSNSNSNNNSNNRRSHLSIYDYNQRFST